MSHSNLSDSSGRVAGKPEVTLSADLFGAQVGNAFYILPDYQKLTHHLPD
jgi:hypothetical protein